MPFVVSSTTLVKLGVRLGECCRIGYLTSLQIMRLFKRPARLDIRLTILSSDTRILHSLDSLTDI